MNIAYFKDTDSLYIELSPENPAHAWEAHTGVILNMSADGRVVAIEIERASQQTDLRARRGRGKEPLDGAHELVLPNRGAWTTLLGPFRGGASRSTACQRILRRSG